MSEDSLDWVGAAPLDESDMLRLRADLIFQRTVVWVPTGMIVALIMHFVFGLPLGTALSFAVLSFALLLALVLGRLAGDSRYRLIRSALFRGLDIAPMLEAESRGLTARFLGLPGGTDILDVAMRPRTEEEMAKAKDPWGRVIYRTRGQDPRGPAEGMGADTIDRRLPRIDAMADRPEFEGIEGELTAGEKLLAEADEVRDERAQQAWAESEGGDADLIEAGVEKLGDLVATGHFEEEGAADAFPEAPIRAPPNTPPPLHGAPAEDPSED